jgi:superfamily II DNA/RNA helicase
MAERLTRRGITVPFPIQTATIPVGLAGRDLCGRAPTGSGKTLAFGIPLVSRVGRARPRHPLALVLTPTRELAAQVGEELTKLSGQHGPRVSCFYGGVGFGPQIKALRSGTDVVVACPGRLADLIDRREVSLDAVEIVVVDEADRMADMGFLPQVRALLDQVRPDRQTMLFSATLDGNVGALVRRYQSDPVRAEVAPAETDPRSQHVFWQAERTERTELTAQLIQLSWPAIVFCRTKRGADRLTSQLVRAGVSANAMHGDRSQGQRERALAGFAAGRVQALVATDIAARGIHVDDVACVIHYDPPEDDKAYVHRSGRTGRAGTAGLIVSLVSGEHAAGTRKLQNVLGLPRGIHAPNFEVVRPEGGTAPKPVPFVPQPTASPERPAGRSRPRRPAQRGQGNQRQGNQRAFPKAERTGRAVKRSHRAGAKRA